MIAAALGDISRCAARSLLGRRLARDAAVRAAVDHTPRRRARLP
jgi:hypothetical protein